MKHDFEIVVDPDTFSREGATQKLHDKPELSEEQLLVLSSGVNQMGPGIFKAPAPIQPE